ncbi:MAG TPA: Sir2 family NAD-dependent protein deacetylase [Conexibacter sp.]|nr:Sir2 family NAD-dependent protein deacetylase [Conexibacter sp.]
MRRAVERRGAIDAVITQNVDRLHARAGTQQLIELHGSIATSSCLACGARHPLEEVRRRLAADPEGVPRCDCGRPLKPDVVLFGEYLPAGALECAEALAGRAELLVCVGSSLEVHPAAGLASTTLAAGGEVALVTQGPTPYDREALLKLDGDVVQELAALVEALGRA